MNKKEIILTFFDEVYNKHHAEWILTYYAENYLEHHSGAARSNLDVV